MLHRFNPIGCFSRPAMKHRPGGFIPLYRQPCGRDVIHVYVAGLVPILRYPGKMAPRGRLFRQILAGGQRSGRAAQSRKGADTSGA